MKRIWKFFKDEQGLETAEYAVMGALVLLVVVAAVLYLRGEIATAFNAIADTIKNAGS